MGWIILAFIVGLVVGFVAKRFYYFTDYRERA
jgi:uncharacterized membrane protein YeaQ/YmgE (transglycosylase-associated protein family)